MKFLVTGADGQLAFDLLQILPDNTVAFTHSQLDITQPEAVWDCLNKEKPTVVINTAAFTQVDECESQIEKAFSVNARGVWHLAQACSKIGAFLVQISTDYVFGNPDRQIRKEEDAALPQGVYAISKLAGEYFCRAMGPKHLVIRSSGFFGKGASGKKGNFVETMIRLAQEGRPIQVVNDQTFSPTYTKDLAKAIADLISTQVSGVYHITNGGACTWYEFAQTIFSRRGFSPEITPVTSAEYGAPAVRPGYSVLSNEKLHQRKIGPLRSWQEALEEYLHPF